MKKIMVLLLLVFLFGCDKATRDGFVYLDGSGNCYDSNDVIIIDANTFDPNSLVLPYSTIDANTLLTFSSWPPEPTHKCPVHGIIDYVNQSELTIDVNEVCITRVCMRCLSDLINKNLPKLELIDPNERKNYEKDTHSNADTHCIGTDRLPGSAATTATAVTITCNSETDEADCRMVESR